MRLHDRSRASELVVGATGRGGARFQEFDARILAQCATNGIWKCAHDALRRGSEVDTW